MMCGIIISWLVVCFVFTSVWSSDVEINYNDNYKWAEKYPACGGKQQSPIALHSKWLKNCVCSPIKYINFNVALTINMVNEGNTVTEYFISKRGKEPIVEISGERFRVLHSRTNGGTLHTPGSEHTIDNVRTTAEYSTLFRNIKYCPEVAQDYPDGHLRIIRRVQTVDANYPRIFKAWDALFNVTSLVSAFNSSTTVPVKTTLAEHLGLMSLLYGKRMPAYTYWGSETRPPCFPAYTIVFHDPLYVYHPKLIDMVSLQNECGHPITNNYRPLQKRNGRRVTGIC